MKCLFERLLEVIIAALHKLPLRALAADSAEMQPLVFQVFPPRYISTAEEEDKKLEYFFFGCNIRANRFSSSLKENYKLVCRCQPGWWQQISPSETFRGPCLNILEDTHCWVLLVDKQQGPGLIHLNQPELIRKKKKIQARKRICIYWASSAV